MSKKSGKSIFENIIVVILGALICDFLWGSAFPFIKIGYKLFEIDGGDTATQILFGGVRFVLAGILAVIIGSIIQKHILNILFQILFRMLVIAMVFTILKNN